MANMLTNKYIKYGLILLLSVSLIVFTQEIKHLKNPDSMPVTSMTFLGLSTFGSFL